MNMGVRVEQNGGIWIAVRSPFLPSFVDAVKRIKAEERIWLDGVKLWLVWPTKEPFLRDLLVVQYGHSQICETCWTTNICDTWRRIHWNAIGQGVGGLAENIPTDPPPAWRSEVPETPRPSPPPPRPPPPPPPRPRAPLSSLDRYHEARTVLEVGPRATVEEIKAAVKRLALLHHPDRGGSTQRMAEILVARDRLLGKVIRGR